MPLGNKHLLQKVELYVLTKKSICDKFLGERSKIKSNVDSIILLVCMCIYNRILYYLFIR